MGFKTGRPISRPGRKRPKRRAKSRKPIHKQYIYPDRAVTVTWQESPGRSVKSFLENWAKSFSKD